MRHQSRPPDGRRTWPPDTSKLSYDHFMLRALFVATLLVVSSPAVFSQAPVPGILHIKVVLVDADRKATPVLAMLLIGDNPG